MNMDILIKYAIMIIAAIIAIVGYQNSKKGAAWGQPVAIIFGIIVIGIGFWQAYANSFGNAASNEAIARETAYQVIQTRVLGKYVAEKFAGKKAILITDPYGQPDNPMLKGLKEGLGTAIEIVDEVSPTPPKVEQPQQEGMPPMIMPTEMWFDGKALSSLISGKKVDLVITTIGLPRNVGVSGKDFNLLALKGKKVVIASGSIYEYVNAFVNGNIVAAVTYKPNAIYDEKPVPKKEQEAFDKRFLLITSENIQQVAKDNSGIFMGK